MPDGPFRSMTRSPEDTARLTWGHYEDLYARPGAICDRCGTEYYEGDWPWCKGDPEGHRR